MTAVTVVTGAAGAMGGACARVLGTRTDVLLLTDVDERRLDTAATAIAREGSVAVHPFVADLGDPAAVAELATARGGARRAAARWFTRRASPRRWLPGTRSCAST